MAQKPIVQNIPQQEQGQQAVTRARPHYLAWPTSKPGPRSTPPPPGMRPINPYRSEQVLELGYNQASGEPGSDSPFRSMPDANITGPTAPGQMLTAQEELKRRKHRIE